MSYRMPPLKEIGVSIQRPRPPAKRIGPRYVSASGMGAYAPAGLGISTEDLTGAIDVAAQIVRDPHGVLKARGPAIVSAVDQHILDPTISSIAEGLTPYIIKYVVPPIAILYFMVGVSTYYSYKSYRAHPTVPNKRRRRRRRKRTSR